MTVRQLPALATAVALAASLSACAVADKVRPDATIPAATTSASTTTSSPAPTPTETSAEPDTSATSTDDPFATPSSSTDAGTGTASATPADGAGTPAVTASGTPAPEGALIVLPAGSKLPSTVGRWTLDGAGTSPATYSDGVSTLTVTHDPKAKFEIMASGIVAPTLPAGTGICGSSYSGTRYMCVLATTLNGSITIEGRGPALSAADLATFSNELTRIVGTDKTKGAGTERLAPVASGVPSPGKLLKAGALPKKVGEWVAMPDRYSPTTDAMYEKGDERLMLSYLRTTVDRGMRAYPSKVTPAGTGQCGISPEGDSVGCFLAAEGGTVFFTKLLNSMPMEEAVSLANALPAAMGTK